MASAQNSNRISKRANSNTPQTFPHNRNWRNIVKLFLQGYNYPDKDETKKEVQTNFPYEHCKNTQQNTRKRNPRTH